MKLIVFVGAFLVGGLVITLLGYIAIGMFRVFAWILGLGGKD